MELYVNGFHMVPVFVRDVDDEMIPVHRYRDEWITGLHELDEVLSLYSRVRGRIDGVALATGPYNSVLGVGRGVLDIDDLLGNRVEDVVRLVSRRYPAVVTRRGFHIHFLMESNPYILVARTSDNKHIGEGGVTYPHLWTSPPSIRGGFRYRWMINGEFVDDPTDAWRKLGELFGDDLLPVTDVDELSNDISGVLGETVIVEEKETSKPSTTGLTILGKSGTERKGWKPFRKIDELLQSYKLVEKSLPPCILEFITKTLYHHLNEEKTALNIWERRRDIDYPGNKVPHGRRFLTLLTYMYLVLNLVEEVDIGYLNDIFYSITEDYPGDRGEPLDKKLSRLISGTIDNPEPRYSTLGSMGEMYCSKTYNNICRYKALCLGKKPWLPVRLIMGRVEEEVKRLRRRYEKQRRKYYRYTRK